MKFYEKISNTKIFADGSHFYKYIRYVFFGRLIFCIDVYPSQITIGFMIAYTSKQWTIARLT